MTKPTGNKIGRPSKSDLVETKSRTLGKRGRPPGDAAIINDYKLRMLNSPKLPLTMNMHTKLLLGS
jgi:hypothetical protein